MATILISIKDITGEPVACVASFIPASTPHITASSLVISGKKNALMDEHGEGQIILDPGSYFVRFFGVQQNTDVLTIVVPDDNSEYSLVDLITNGLAVPPEFGAYLLAKKNLEDVENPAEAFGNIKQSATLDSSGVMQIATVNEVGAGESNNKAVTPYSMASIFSGFTGNLIIGDKTLTFAKGILKSIA